MLLNPREGPHVGVDGRRSPARPRAYSGQTWKARLSQTAFLTQVSRSPIPAYPTTKKIHVRNLNNGWKWKNE